MLAAGEALAEEHSYDLVHGHDWLVAHASAALADRLGVPYVTTIHATEHGRHQGWVQDQPQSHIHAVERWMAQRADAVIVCSYYMRGHVADIFDIDERRIAVIPNGIDPSDLRPVGRPAGAAARVRRARGEARAAGRAARLREGLPARARRAAGRDRAGRQRALPGRRLRHARGRAEGPGASGWGSPSTAPSSAGSATTCCTRSTGSPTCAWCRRSTSRSGWWRSRRWPRAARASSPTPAACARSCRSGERVGLRFNGGDAEHLGVMIERLLVDERAARPAGDRGLRARAALRLGRHRPAHARDLQRRWREPALREEGAPREDEREAMLKGLMQDDFPLTLHHILRRMRDCTRGARS